MISEKMFLIRGLYLFMRKEKLYLKILITVIMVVLGLIAYQSLQPVNGEDIK